MPDAADMMLLASLTRLTHLHLGSPSGVAALAPLLPDLRSLVLHLEYERPSASANATSCCS